MSHWNRSGTEDRSKAYRSGRSIESGVALVGRAPESMGCAVGSLGIVLEQAKM